MYCTFTTCMYVYMLTYMSAYICVCMHVYVIYVSEGLRKKVGLLTDTKTKLRLKNNRTKTHFKRPTGNPDNRIMTAVKPVVTLGLFISS